MKVAVERHEVEFNSYQTHGDWPSDGIVGPVIMHAGIGTGALPSVAMRTVHESCHPMLFGSVSRVSMAPSRHCAPDPTTNA